MILFGRWGRRLSRFEAVYIGVAPLAASCFPGDEMHDMIFGVSHRPALLARSVMYMIND